MVLDLFRAPGRGAPGSRRSGDLREEKTSIQAPGAGASVPASGRAGAVEPGEECRGAPGTGGAPRYRGASTQLRLVRPIAADCPGSDSMTRTGSLPPSDRFRRARALLGSLPHHPCGIAPGRPKGPCRGSAPRRLAIEKTP